MLNRIFSAKYMAVTFVANISLCNAASKLFMAAVSSTLKMPVYSIIYQNAYNNTYAFIR